jgi:hypothetical protein
VQGGRVLYYQLKQVNTMEDIERYDDGAFYSELTEEEQLALEDNEFPTQPQFDKIRDDMESITSETDKLQELLSK